MSLSEICNLAAGSRRKPEPKITTVESLSATKFDVAELAERVARNIHQHDYYGRGANVPYTIHLSDVANNVTGAFYKAVAWLHDSLEDHPEFTRDDLIDQHGIPAQVVDVVEIITKKPDEEYEQYIIRVSKSYAATVVKVADLLSNLRAQPPKRLVRRYAKALTVLTSKMIPNL